MSNDSEPEDEEQSTPADEPVDDDEIVDETAEEEPETAEEDEPEGVQDGEVVVIDYTARTVEDDRLVDTTDPDVADEEGVETDQEIAPRTIVLGEGHIFPSVEDALIGSEAGDTGSVVVPAQEAFGEYDDEQVRTVSKDKIPEDNRHPGAQVRIDGEEAFVETIIGGRARVDFNHPLAGNDIEYEWELLEVVEDREEKASGLLEMFLGMPLEIRFQTDVVEEEQLVEEEDEDSEDDEAEEAEDSEDEEEESEPTYETVEVEKESLYIEATPMLSMNEQWLMQKQQIATQLMELVDVDRIVVEEVLDGSGMGFPGMMGGMGGGGLEGLEDADIDAEALAEELGE